MCFAVSSFALCYFLTYTILTRSILETAVCGQLQQFGEHLLLTRNTASFGFEDSLGINKHNVRIPTMMRMPQFTKQSPAMNSYNRDSPLLTVIGSRRGIIGNFHHHPWRRTMSFLFAPNYLPATVDQQSLIFRLFCSLGSTLIFHLSAYFRSLSLPLLFKRHKQLS